MIIELVAAISENNVLGKDGKLPWHLPADLAFFMDYIKNDWLITGRKSYESIEGIEIFAHRKDVIVLTQNRDYFNFNSSVVVLHSIRQAVEFCSDRGINKVLILGGAEIYRQSIDIAHRLVITRIHHTFEGDAFFPEIDLNKWKLVQDRAFKKDGLNPFDYSFQIFEKKDSE